jgi:hypothetical protein
MAIGLSTGGFPSKLTVPVMVDAARATPGQNDIATSTAASHNLFPLPHMFNSLVIVHLSLSSSQTTQRVIKRGQSAQASNSRRLYTKLSIARNITSALRIISIAKRARICAS